MYKGIELKVDFQKRGMIFFILDFNSLIAIISMKKKIKEIFGTEKLSVERNKDQQLYIYYLNNIKSVKYIPYPKYPVVSNVIRATSPVGIIFKLFKKPF